MKRVFSVFVIFAFSFFFSGQVLAQNESLSPTIEIEDSEEATASSTVIERAEPTPVPRHDITKETVQTIEPLKKLLQEQELGSILPLNPIKYAIRGAVSAGVPPNTIVLLLLLPGVATFIAAARHLIGLRGFGIFLPAALAVSFVATGPIVGIVLFLMIVAVSTLARIVLRRVGLKLQYLPRMAMILLFVVLGILLILFAQPLIGRPDIANVSIFPVLILVLLAEDFSKAQLGKSAKVAINLTTETLILSLVSYVLLTTKGIQEFALLRPEIWIIAILIVDFLLGKYVGLRFLEVWRFRRLITG